MDGCLLRGGLLWIHPWYTLNKMGKFGMQTIWSDLDGLNSSTTSLELVPIQITHVSKYINVLPQGGGLGEAVESPWCKFPREGFPWGVEMTSQWGEGAFLEGGSLGE